MYRTHEGAGAEHGFTPCRAPFQGIPVTVEVVEAGQAQEVHATREANTGTSGLT